MSKFEINIISDLKVDRGAVHDAEDAWIEVTIIGQNAYEIGHPTLKSALRMQETDRHFGLTTAVYENEDYLY